MDICDSDGDGSSDNHDCAPDDPAIHPYAREINCNGIDENCSRGDCCDQDDDDDGFACREDCDDGDQLAYPGAPTPPGCYIRDRNCDGVIDGIDCD